MPQLCYTGSVWEGCAGVSVVTARPVNYPQNVSGRLSKTLLHVVIATLLCNLCVSVDQSQIFLVYFFHVFGVENINTVVLLMLSL